MSNFDIDKCREDGWRCKDDMGRGVILLGSTNRYGWPYGVQTEADSPCGKSVVAFNPDGLRNLPREPKVRRCRYELTLDHETVLEGDHPIISHDDGKTWKLDREKIAREEVVQSHKDAVEQTYAITSMTLMRQWHLNRIAELEKEAE